MVEAGKITLRIEIDQADFINKVGQIKGKLGELDIAALKTGQAVEKMGKETITNAVRFQTLSQGAINLTTSLTQTYTSVSNLQRAKTSLAASAVGVERALDLQARKQFQLREEQKKAIPNLGKITLLTNELATAHDDLSVKQQRVKDQTDAVNDTYVLFALNLATVGFSAIQTIKTMKDMTQGMKLASLQGSILNATMGKFALVAIAVIAAWEILVGHLKIFGEQASKDLTLQGKMNEMFGASTITLDNYQKKIDGVTSAQSKMNAAVSAGAKAYNELNPSMQVQIDFLNQMITDSTSPAMTKALANQGRMMTLGINLVKGGGSGGNR